MYQIFEVPVEAAESTEQLGTKFKFWYRDPNFGLSLFKEGRPGTGENWAEKIACELAKILGIPHAHYDFAKYGGKDGVVSRTLVESGARLIHGNEVLASFVTGYSPVNSKFYHRREHTMPRLLSYFRASTGQVGAPYGFKQTEKVSTALDVFIGYLMFDAWIANQDRHDQNWGLLRSADGNNFLAPSYDHGSSMARNETDEARTIRLTTQDGGRHISRYVMTARSAIYSSNSQHGTKSLLTLDAFLQAGHQNIEAAQSWQHQISLVTEKEIHEIFQQVPNELMSQTARTFTIELLKLNRQRILDCKFSR